MATCLIMYVMVKNSVTPTAVRVTSLSFRRSLMVLIFGMTMVVVVVSVPVQLVVVI